MLALLVGVWDLRLASFLFARIRREGADRRFDALKPGFEGTAIRLGAEGSALRPTSVGFP
jgi:steroid 5-alpha reductase family enzyme